MASGTAPPSSVSLPWVSSRNPSLPRRPPRAAGRPAGLRPDGSAMSNRQTATPATSRNPGMAAEGSLQAARMAASAGSEISTVAWMEGISAEATSVAGLLAQPVDGEQKGREADRTRPTPSAAAAGDASVRMLFASSWADEAGGDAGRNPGGPDERRACPQGGKWRRPGRRNVQNSSATVRVSSTVAPTRSQDDSTRWRARASGRLLGTVAEPFRLPHIRLAGRERNRRGDHLPGPVHQEGRAGIRNRALQPDLPRGHGQPVGRGEIGRANRFGQLARSGRAGRRSQPPALAP